MRGEMTITFALADADGGTDILAVHDRLPPGLSAADNETGWRMSLDKLAALVEGIKARAIGALIGCGCRDTDTGHRIPIGPVLGRPGS